MPVQLKKHVKYKLTVQPDFFSGLTEIERKKAEKDRKRSEPIITYPRPGVVIEDLDYPPWLISSGSVPTKTLREGGLGDES
jgi:hypothetical protein